MDNTTPRSSKIWFELSNIFGRTIATAKPIAHYRGVQSSARFMEDDRLNGTLTRVNLGPRKFWIVLMCDIEASRTRNNFQNGILLHNRVYFICDYGHERIELKRSSRNKFKARTRSRNRTEMLMIPFKSKLENKLTSREIFGVLIPQFVLPISSTWFLFNNSKKNAHFKQYMYGV